MPEKHPLNELVQAVTAAVVNAGATTSHSELNDSLRTLGIPEQRLKGVIQRVHDLREAVLTAVNDTAPVTKPKVPKDNTRANTAVSYDPAIPYVREESFPDEFLKMSDPEIFNDLRNVLIDALGVEDDEVTPEAKVINDLGAESIDFLDIFFRLEKQFGVKFPRGGAFSENLFDRDFDDQFAETLSDGKPTANTLVLLQTAIPHADFTGFLDKPLPEDYRDFVTVQMLMNYIKARQAAGKVAASKAQ